MNNVVPLHKRKPTRRTTVDGLSRLTELGIDPLEELVDLLNHPRTTIEMRVQILKTLIKYGYPTLKSLEATTPRTRSKIAKLEASGFQTELDFRGDTP